LEILLKKIQLHIFVAENCSQGTYVSLFVTDPRFDMVYGRRQPRTKNVSFEFRRREGFSSAHEVAEDVPEPPRRSKRAAGRINLPRGAMRIEDSEPGSTSSDDDEESPYRKEPSPPESPTAAAQCKRKGKNIRTASHEHSQGTGEDDSDGKYEASQFLDRSPLRVVMRLTSM
jgi:hypothetical protein